MCGCTPCAIRSGRGEQHSGSAVAEWVGAVHSTLTALPRDVAERADSVNADAFGRCARDPLFHSVLGLRRRPHPYAV